MPVIFRYPPIHTSKCIMTLWDRCPFSLPLSRHPSDSNFLDHDPEKITVIHHRSERRHTSISPLEYFATPVRPRLSGARWTWTALIYNGHFLLFYFWALTTIYSSACADSDVLIEHLARNMSWYCGVSEWPIPCRKAYKSRLGWSHPIDTTLNHIYYYYTLQRILPCLSHVLVPTGSGASSTPISCLTCKAEAPPPVPPSLVTKTATAARTCSSVMIPWLRGCKLTISVVDHANSRLEQKNNQVDGRRKWHICPICVSPEGCK